MTLIEIVKHIDRKHSKTSAFIEGIRLLKKHFPHIGIPDFGNATSVTKYELLRGYLKMWHNYPEQIDLATSVITQDEYN